MIYEILLIIAVIGIVYFMFIKKKPPRKFSKTPSKKKEKPQSNDMVECESCGVYVELGEAIISSNKYYCCDECVDKA